MRCPLRKAQLDRLAAYEDTGRMPNEVTAMIAENARLRAELEAAKGDIRDMLRADHSDEFCEKCKSHKVNAFCMLRNCDNAEWRGATEDGGGKNG